MSVCVYGLWHTHVRVAELTTWAEVKEQIWKKAAVPRSAQLLTPRDEDDEDDDDEALCGLSDGDELDCEWDQDLREFEGQHPLHFAGESGNIDALRSWVASGADINVRDDGKSTPLMYAAKGLSVECVAEMLRMGANARLVDDTSSSALHWLTHGLHAGESCTREKVSTILKMLVDAGCDRRGCDFQGFSVDRLAHDYISSMGYRAVTPWPDDGWFEAELATRRCRRPRVKRRVWEVDE